MRESDLNVREIVQQVDHLLGGVLVIVSASWIVRPETKGQVSDAHFALYVDGKHREHDIVLLVSNTDFPDTVSEATACAASVIAAVHPGTSNHILTPLIEGKHQGQSFAAFRRLEKLSDLRPVRLIQKARLSKSVTQWLADLALESRQAILPDDFDRLYEAPLSRLAADDRLPVEVRKFADSALHYVRGLAGSLSTVVTHGDFWSGNLHFDYRSFPRINPFLGQFHVIDWRGAWLDGYPCIDLVRYCLSSHRTDSRRAARMVEMYLAALGLSRFDMAVYCALSLGRLGSELEQFPPERYALLCKNVFAFLKVHGDFTGNS